MSRRERERPGFRQSLTPRGSPLHPDRPTRPPRRPRVVGEGGDGYARPAALNLGAAGLWSLALVACVLLVALAGGDPRAAAAAPAAPLPTLAPLGQVGGMMAAVATLPGRLLAGEGAALVVFDTTHLPLTRGARVELPTAPQDIAVDGERAYVAAGAGGLQVVGLDAPGLRLLGSAVTTGKARGVAASGDNAYVAAELAGLRVFDVAQPEQPVEVGHVSVGARALALAVRPPYVYVAAQYFDPQTASNTFLAVIDASHPDAPQLVTRVQGDAVVSDLAAEGDRLYLATNRGLRVMSLADPALPTEVGRYPAAGYYTLYSLAVRGDVVTVGHYQSGVEEFRINPQGQPSPVCAGCPSPYPDPSRANVVSVAVDAARTYVADGDALRVLAAAEGSLPPRLHTVETLLGFTLADDVALADGYAYLGVWPTGLVVADMQASPRLIYHHDLVTPDTSPDIRGVATTGGALFLAGGEGLARYDRTDPARPVYRDSLRLGVLTSVAAAGGRAFASDGTHLFAATLTATPLTATIPLTSTLALAASGETVYAAGEGGLRVLRWPQGAGAPTLVGGYAALRYCAVSVVGDLVAAADNGGVDLLRVTPQGTVARAGRYEPAAPPVDVVLAGDSLFVLDATGRVLWLDVRDAGNPSPVAEAVAGGGGPAALAAGGGTGAALDLTGGLFAWRAVRATLFLPLVAR